MLDWSRVVCGVIVGVICGGELNVVAASFVVSTVVEGDGLLMAGALSAVTGVDGCSGSDIMGVSSVVGIGEECGVVDTSSGSLGVGGGEMDVANASSITSVGVGGGDGCDALVSSSMIRVFALSRSHLRVSIVSLSNFFRFSYIEIILLLLVELSSSD